MIQRPVTITFNYEDTSSPITVTFAESVSTNTSMSYSAPATGLDSEAGDIATLEALYDSSNGSTWTDNTNWGSSGMSLDSAPYGVTVETINSELRVTKLDLRNNNLTGNIEIDNWDNLKECGYVNLTFNSLNTQIPQGLIDLPKNEYLYLCRSDDSQLDINTDPHETAQTGGGDVHPGKSKGSEENVFTGHVPGPTDPASLILKYMVLNFTDTYRHADNPDGISSIGAGLFEITTFEILQIYVNANLESTPFPSGLANMTNMDNFAFPGGFDYVTGSVPDIGGLSDARFLRIDGSDFLTVDVDAINWAGLTNARQISFSSNDITGTAVPAALFDGSMPEIYAIEMPFPADGVGIGGAFPEVAAGLNGGIGYKIVQFRRHSITSLPASFWNNSPAIIQLDFTHNELTTIGTSDLSNMGSLRYLRLSNNELHEDAPYLPWDNHLGQGIELDNNRYVFKHLLYVPPSDNEVSSLPAEGSEDREVVFNTTDETFYRWDADAEVWNDIGQVLLELYQSVTDAGETEYASQKAFGSEDDYDSGTSTIDFSSIVTHTDNSYTWQRSTDGGSSFSAIGGETSNTLDVSSYDAGDQFYLEVTNSTEASIGTGITLTSTTITI